MNYDETSVIAVLKSVFGYENFQNTVQKDAVAVIIQGAQCVCISMPPGFGRSLCFQLPAILQEGKVTLVFSTKLFFMKKQIDFLRSKQINACLLHRSMYFNKKNSIVKDLTSTSPKIVLLYATLDMIMVPYFQQLIFSLKQRELLSYIVYNEAHCVSKLGYEYAPIYEYLEHLNTVLKDIPQIAITTTVTDEVIEDICNVLALETPEIFKLTVQKINVYCDIWFLDTLSQPFEHLRNFIMEMLGFLDPTGQKIQRGFAIIYCSETVTAELLKNKLNGWGISTLTYHHKLKDSIQKNIENKWISGDACVITTTYNYGFIYRKSIRCTIYWTVVESITKYYRELAQTHSDSDQTYCRVYFSMKEYSSVKSSIENHKVMKDTEQIKHRLSEYNKFVSYCLSVKCRHEIISNYFGYTASPCNTDCDVCKSKEVVEIRTSKFITFSESVEGIKYNICNISLSIKKIDVNSDISTEKRSKDTLTKATRKETAEDADERIVQCNTTLQSTKQEQFPARSSSPVSPGTGGTQISTESAVNSNEDNIGSVHVNSATQALINGNELGKSVTRQQPSTSSQISISPVEIFDKKNIFQTKIDERSFHNSSTNFDINNCLKRLRVSDTGSKNIIVKKRKLDADIKAPTEAEKMKDKRIGTDQRAKHATKVANVSVSRDKTIIEHLMNKYNLNSELVTLEIQRKRS